MGELKLIIIALFLFFSNKAKAHMDFYNYGTYGNVKVGIKTGFHYEEIAKVHLIAQLAKKISSELNYSKPIYLEFEHLYVENVKTDFFISFDKGHLEKEWKNGLYVKNSRIKSKQIVVTQVGTQFDILSTLKLLEFAILNKKMISNTQKPMIFNKNYSNWQLNSIDSISIANILNKPNSELIEKYTKMKVENRTQSFQNVAYFWQNNKFYIYGKFNHFDKKSLQMNTTDSTLLVLDNIFQFCYLGYDAIVFDTDSTFFKTSTSPPYVSKRQLIKEREDNYITYRLEKIGNNKLAIIFEYNDHNFKLKSSNRTLIYFEKEDELIQDLDELINYRIIK